jgi:hypothetical protein
MERGRELVLEVDGLVLTIGIAFDDPDPEQRPHRPLPTDMNATATIASNVMSASTSPVQRWRLRGGLGT